jgi:hypothetical protein
MFLRNAGLSPNYMALQPMKTILLNIKKLLRVKECTVKYYTKLKNHWGTLVPRINVEDGIKLGFVLE